MREFKVGDNVYYPSYTSCMLTIKENKGGINYPLFIEGRSFTSKGMYNSDDHSPSLFHATPDNHKLLEKLYNRSFERPKNNWEGEIQDILDYLESRTSTTHNSDIQFVSGDFILIGIKCYKISSDKDMGLILIQHVSSGEFFSRQTTLTENGYDMNKWKHEDDITVVQQSVYDTTNGWKLEGRPNEL